MDKRITDVNLCYFMLVLQRKLVKAQPEGWGHGKEVVEDVRLDGLVLGPDLVAQKEVHLDGHSELCGFALCNNQVKVLCHNRMAAQVSLNVYPHCCPLKMWTVNKS